MAWSQPEINIEELKELSFEDFVKMAVTQVLTSALEDVVKYCLAVDNMECLLINEERDKELIEDFSKKWNELEEKYGKKDELSKQKEYAVYRFKKLIRKMRKMTPIEVVGVV